MKPAQDELRFERLERLGAGGMAVVWRALDRKLKREVALKELHPEIAGHGEGIARFRHEAEAIARLSHPNVVAFYDAADEGPRTVLVLELVRGAPLDKVLAGKDRPPLRRVVELLEKAARGVHHAHEQGVIHRDLKPSNILVTDEGEPKVSDFGLAHLSGEMITTLTKTGALLGTPSYMAPEQARGDRHAVDRRTDVYALGAVLYEVLAGAPPFRADSVHALVHEVIHRDPPEPRSHRKDVPIDLQTIAMKCLAKEPDRRYATALDFAEELRRWLEGRPIEARPPSRTELVALWVRRNRTLSALLLVTVLASAGGSVAGGLSLHARLEREREVREAREREARALEDRERAVRDEIERVRAGTAPEGAADRIVAIDAPRTVELLEGALAATTAQLVSATRAVYLSANVFTAEEAAQGARPIADLERVVEQIVTKGDWSRGDLDVVNAIIKRVENRAIRALPPGADIRGADIRTIVGVEQRTRVPEGEHRVARLACEALGRLRRPSSVTALVDYLAVVASQMDASLAGEALARIGGARAEAGLLMGSQRFGSASLFWTRVKDKLPASTPAPPVVDAPDGAESAEALKRRGIGKSKKRDFDGAIADLTSSIALDPGDGFAWYNRALARYQKGDLDGALSDASKAVQLAPSDGGFLGFRGNVRRTRGDLRGAIADLVKAVELDPDRATTRIYLGQAHLASNEPQKTIADVTSALYLEPDNLIALNTRGIAKRRVKDTDGAIADYSRALALDPNFATALANRGSTYLERGEIEKGFADLARAIQLEPRNSNAYLERGRAYLKKGEFGASIADFDTVISFQPRNAGAWLMRAQAKGDSGDLAGAIEDLERAHELQPKSGAILNNLGMMRKAAGDLDGALRDLERGVRVEPAHAQCVWNRGLVRGLKGDLKGEIEDATAAIDLEDEWPFPRATRAVARAKLGDREGAFADVERAIELGPGLAIVWHARAQVKLLFEDFAGAVADETRALELAPKEADCYEVRARAREKLGEADGARADRERARELRPRAVSK